MTSFDLKRRSVLAGILAMPALSLAGQPVFAASGGITLGNFGSPNPQTLGRITGAYAEGFGPDVETSYITVNSAPQIIGAMAGGSLDICNVGASPFVSAAATGQKISAVYINRVITSSEALIVSDASSIMTLADLRGKKIGVPFNTTAHYALTGALKKAGLLPTDVSLFNMKPDAIYAAWEQKSIDAAYIWNPILGKLLASSGSLLLNSGDLIEDGYLVFEILAVRNDLKAERPELIESYIRSYREVYKALKAKDAETMAQLIKYTGLKEDAINAYIDGFEGLTPQQVVSDAWMGKPGDEKPGVISAMDDQLEFMKQARQVNQSATVDFRDYFDASFAAKIAGQG